MSDEVVRLRGVGVRRDGSMLLSDDFNGAVYRISYGPGATVAR